MLFRSTPLLPAKLLAPLGEVNAASPLLKQAGKVALNSIPISAIAGVGTSKADNAKDMAKDALVSAAVGTVAAPIIHTTAVGLGHGKDIAKKFFDDTNFPTGLAPELATVEGTRIPIASSEPKTYEDITRGGLQATRLAKHYEEKAKKGELSDKLPQELAEELGKYPKSFGTAMDRATKKMVDE